MKCALLVIDMLKGYYKGFSKGSMDKASEYINGAIEIFRKNGLPVIWVQDYGKDGADSKTAEFDAIDVLKQDTKDKIILKRYKNGFNKTGLLNYISENSVDVLIITGYSAAHCVLSTYRAAEDYDLRPILLRGAIAGDSDENIRFVENINEIISIKILEIMAGEGGAA
jgi:nicotinamidase-related amidase